MMVCQPGQSLIANASVKMATLAIAARFPPNALQDLVTNLACMVVWRLGASLIASASVKMATPAIGARFLPLALLDQMVVFARMVVLPRETNQIVNASVLLATVVQIVKRHCHAQQVLKADRVLMVARLQEPLAVVSVSASTASQVIGVKQTQFLARSKATLLSSLLTNLDP